MPLTEFMETDQSFSLFKGTRYGIDMMARVIIMLERCVTNTTTSRNAIARDRLEKPRIATLPHQPFHLRDLDLKDNCPSGFGQASLLKFHLRLFDIICRGFDLWPPSCQPSCQCTTLGLPMSTSRTILPRPAWGSPDSLHRHQSEHYHFPARGPEIPVPSIRQPARRDPRNDSQRGSRVGLPT